MTGHDDENLAYEDDQVLIVDKALQAKVDDAHPIRKTDQTSGVKTITSAKRKCIMCKGLAGLDEANERRRRTASATILIAAPEGQRRIVMSPTELFFVRCVSTSIEKKWPDSVSLRRRYTLIFSLTSGVMIERSLTILV